MKILIAGAGSVGRHMAAELADTGHELTVIDLSGAAAARVQAKGSQLRVVTGDACDLEVLTRAGTSEADVVAAVTGDDEDNLVIALLAKQEFGVPRVIARVNNPNNEWMFNDMWGVDVSVSTPHLLTALVEEAVTVGSFVRLLSFANGAARLAEVTLADTSPAAGRPVADLGLPRESTVVAVLRDGHVVVPRGDTVLHRGDEVILLVTGDAEAAVRKILIGVNPP